MICNDKDSKRPFPKPTFVLSFLLSVICEYTSFPFWPDFRTQCLTSIGTVKPRLVDSW